MNAGRKSARRREDETLKRIAIRLITIAALGCSLALQPAAAQPASGTTSEEMTRAVLPIVGKVEGLDGTRWDTEIRLLNLSGAATDVTLEFFPAGPGGHDAPRLTRNLTVDDGEHLALSGWASVFPGAGEAGLGAMRVVSTRAIVTVARIYNDQRAIGNGTYGQFVPAQRIGTRVSGALPMLANSRGPGGFRTNIGWFNDSGSSVSAKFRAYVPGGTPGTAVATAVRSIASYSQSQESLNELFPDLESYDNLYVTWESTNGPLYVYASVIDNVTGDPIFIPAQ